MLTQQLSATDEDWGQIKDVSTLLLLNFKLRKASEKISVSMTII